MHHQPDHYAYRRLPASPESGERHGNPQHLEAYELAVTNKDNSIRAGSADAASLSRVPRLSLHRITASVHSFATARGALDLSRGRRTTTFRQTRSHWSLQGERPARTKMTLPVHRSIVAIDIEDSTQRTNPVKEELRQQVYQLVLDALDKAGIDLQDCDPFTDRGDGVLVLVRPTDTIPKPLLLSRFIPALAGLLRAHNDAIPKEEHSRLLRIRAVLHAGEVHYDGKGFFGEDLDVAFRLLDAQRFKVCLRHAIGPIGLVVSDDIYWSVIRHGYDGIDGHKFQPLVTINVAGRRRKGWIHFPALTASLLISHHNAMQ